MSFVDINLAFTRLRVIPEFGSGPIAQEIRLLIDSAEQEALHFMNRTAPPDPVPPDMIDGILLLARAGFDASTPEEIIAYRRAAEMKLMPYRLHLGV